MAQSILTWKLLKLGHTHANVMFDQRSALGSMEWGTLDKALFGLLNMEDADFCKQRVCWSSTVVDARVGELHLRPGQGAFMGDGLVVILSRSTFRSRWHSDNSSICLAADPIAEQFADLSLSGYAGDLFKKILLEQADLSATL